ncbi:MAG: molybdate ABC transporter permease subunit [Rikenellaceae bacterium]
MNDADFWETLLLTGKLAFSTTAILFIIGLPIAYFLAYKRFFARSLIEALISIPMVLPPIVLGFYLLMLYSPNSWFGTWWYETFDSRLAFSFEGILIGSVLFGLPIMIQPLQSGFISIPRNLSDAAETLGKSKLSIFFRVLLPNMMPSIITSLALSFAHCIGEFGVIIMVGGNIPGETRVASIAIYDQVQALQYDNANRYSIVLFVIAVVLLTIIYSFNNRSHKNQNDYVGN